MRLVFGWHLDGASFPETVDASPSSLGDAVVGPQGLLSTLEFLLGLGYPRTPPAVRTAQYLARLSELNDGHLFYSTSFSEDPWGVAEHLLHLRDTLVEHGWDLVVRHGANAGRLRVFAELEANGNTLSPGYSERLRDLSNALSQSCALDIDELTLATERSLIPPAWGHILNQLEKLGVLITNQSLTPRGSPNSDLHLLQQAVLHGAHTPLSGDDTVVFWQADDEMQAAEGAAAWLAADEPSNEDVVIVRGSASFLLDEACHRIGLPRPGGSQNSRWRAALQILPLAFGFSWHPLDPLRLLELLTSSTSPVPRRLARHFKNALHKHPGIGGPLWSKAWDAALEDSRRQHQEQGLTDEEIDEQLVKDRGALTLWLHPKLYDPTIGMPISDARSICSKVQQWALSRAASSDQSFLFQLAAEQAQSLLSIIDRSGLQTINKIQAERILDAVLSSGAKMPGGGSEVAAWSTVDKPGQLWGKAKKVLWWGFLGTRANSRNFIWANEEEQFLASQGVFLENKLNHALREANSWRYPLINGADSILLMVPRMAAGENVTHHPFDHELKEAIQISSNLNKIFRRVDEIYNISSVSISGRTLIRQVIPSATLPIPSVHWTVPPNTIAPRTVESASSVERLLGCPLSWTLEYKAKIRPSSMMSLLEDETLLGNIAHAIVATLLSSQKTWNPSDAADKAAELFDEIAAQMGATLLLPGKTLEIQRAKTCIQRSVRLLIELIVDAGLEVIGCELERSSSFQYGDFTGTLDLLLKDSVGRPVILDLKWTNWPRYKHDSLKDGTSVQLAAYSWLEHDSHTLPPSAGYFMLRQSKLYHSDPDPFPKQMHVRGSSLASVWEVVTRRYVEQMNQLHHGKIGVTGLVTEQAVLDGFFIKPPCNICDYGRLCGKKRMSQ